MTTPRPGLQLGRNYLTGVDFTDFGIPDRYQSNQTARVFYYPPNVQYRINALSFFNQELLVHNPTRARLIFGLVPLKYCIKP